MSILSDFMAAIPAYTGLSPVTFFTILVLFITLYYIVSGFFAAPRHSQYVPPPMEPLPEPVELGDVTEEVLKAYDGSDPKKPILLAVRGQIYDVTRSRAFYGPGGPYALFAGKDASRALAKSSFEDQDLKGDLEGLSALEMNTLQEWEWTFMSKYKKVGQIVSNKTKSREVPVDGENPTDSKNDERANDKVDGEAEQVPVNGETVKSEYENATDSKNDERANDKVDGEAEQVPVNGETVKSE